jgi:hypothetical protein
MTEQEPITAQSKLRADFRLAKPEYKNPRPGTMTRTMAEAMMIYAWSPDWYHLLRFSCAIRTQVVLACVQVLIA